MQSEYVVCTSGFTGGSELQGTTSLAAWFSNPNYQCCQQRHLSAVKRYGPEVCRLINYVTRDSDFPKQTASAQAPSTSVIPVIFEPLTDWRYEEYERCASQQFFSQLVTSLAFEVVGSLIPSGCHRSIMVVGFGERFLTALRGFLKDCLHVAEHGLRVVFGRERKRIADSCRAV